MKYGVSSNTLLLTAGIVWLVAGINILRIGISCSPYRHFLLDNGRALLAAQGLRGQSDIPAVLLHGLPQALPQACTAYHSR